MKLYISEGALLVVGLFYLPVVAWLLWRLWKKLPPHLPVRLGISFIAFFIAMAIPLWDVLVTSVQMADLCPKAGVFVKRSVKVDGYMITTLGAPELLKRGFKYIEKRESEGRITVYTLQGDKVQTQQHLETRYQPMSQHEVKKEAYGAVVKGTLNIDMDKTIVLDRLTKEELGRSVTYRAYPGWADRQTIARIGRLFWMCPVDRTTPDLDLERAVLLPN